MILEFAPGGDLLHKFHHFDDALEKKKLQTKLRKEALNRDRSNFFTDEISNLSAEQKKMTIAHFQKEDIEIQKIYDSLETQQDELDTKYISWNLRLKVALDIAYGMRYLHTSFEEPIIHR